jgi:hypothetical protein
MERAALVALISHIKNGLHFIQKGPLWWFVTRINLLVGDEDERNSLAQLGLGSIS